MSNSNVAVAFVVPTVVIGYKAFDENLKCRDHHFEIGKTYEIKGELVFCKNGFHFCTNMNNCFNYYDVDARICEVYAEDILNEENKSICRKIKIVRELSQKEIRDKIDNSQLAYNWAFETGDVDIMIDKVVDSEYAYMWATTIGNADIMIDRISDAHTAYYWGLKVGNREVMIDRITDSFYAYLWAKNIGDCEIMLSRIKNEDERREIEQMM